MTITNYICRPNCTLNFRNITSMNTIKFYYYYYSTGDMPSHMPSQFVNLASYADELRLFLVGLQIWFVNWNRNENENPTKADRPPHLINAHLDAAIPPFLISHTGCSAVYRAGCGRRMKVTVISLPTCTMAGYCPRPRNKMHMAIAIDRISNTAIYFHFLRRYPLLDTTSGALTPDCFVCKYKNN